MKRRNDAYVQALQEKDPAKRAKLLRQIEIGALDRPAQLVQPVPPPGRPIGPRRHGAPRPPTSRAPAAPGSRIPAGSNRTTSALAPPLRPPRGQPRPRRPPPRDAPAPAPGTPTSSVPIPPLADSSSGVGGPKASAPFDAPALGPYNRPEGVEGLERSTRCPLAIPRIRRMIVLDA